MKRDFDLIREILLACEQKPLGARLYARDLPMRDQDEAAYHLWLLIDAGLIDGRCNMERPAAGLECYGGQLTWRGQEFLAAVRSDTAWSRIRRMAAERAVDLSFEAIVALARQPVTS